MNGRCDRCNAKAYVLTLHSGYPLYWCARHFAIHEHLLEDAVLKDLRNNITATT